ncbi:MAG: PH domain-containing protein [Eubacteriales bacterium]
MEDSLECSFLIWRYRFLDDRILIHRKLWWSRTNLIYIDKIEMTSCITSFIMRAFGRRNLMLTFAGNSFTLFGVPKQIAEKFCARYEGENEEAKGKKISLKPAEIMKMSILQSHFIWYFVLLFLLWSAVFLMSSPLLTADTAKKISDFVFRHMIVAGTLVLSIGLPYAIIWLWAITGGFIKEYLSYYKFSVTRLEKSLAFEYGLFIHRKIYISADRIAIAEFSQPPLMRIFGCGKLYIRAVGYNPFFIKRQPILPYLRSKNLKNILTLLLPEMTMEHRPPRVRKFHYYLFSRKILIPPACLIIACFLGYGWIIAAAVTLTIVMGSLILEYTNTYFECDDRLTVLSHGGFFRTTACIYTDRIELIAKSGSRRKLRKGFTNIHVHVFGKNGSYALIRNVETRQLDPFHIPDEEYFLTEKEKKS